MARIEGIRIRNYRVLKDIALGKTSYGVRTEPLTPLVIVIGKNGSGKSTLFDAFGFLADSLTYGVEEACYKDDRGGFDRLVSSGVKEPIAITLFYRESPQDRPIIYELEVDSDSNGRAYVKKEILRQRRKGQKSGPSFKFLDLSEGKGKVWAGDETAQEETDTKTGTKADLSSNRLLGIAHLGTLVDHPRIVKFRDFIQGWYLSYISPDAIRHSLPMAGPQKHLSRTGDNLGNVVQYLERDLGDNLKDILDRIASRIPGLKSIKTTISADGRLLLAFNDEGFIDPFYAQQMSDGTLKLFSYMVLLEDPNPPPYLCIEEPENGLYHKLLAVLARELREHSEKPSRGSQVFITTHQPYFVDEFDPKETWVIEKAKDGFATLKRACDYPLVTEMVEQGQPLGSLWFSDFFDKRTEE